ncbi:hypothetical protein ACFQ0O_14325 [Saccharopolyspora spinosporotrichia]
MAAVLGARPAGLPTARDWPGATVVKVGFRCAGAGRAGLPVSEPGTRAP